MPSATRSGSSMPFAAARPRQSAALAVLALGDRVQRCRRRPSDRVRWPASAPEVGFWPAGSFGTSTSVDVHGRAQRRAVRA